MMAALPSSDSPANSAADSFPVSAAAMMASAPSDSERDIPTRLHAAQGHITKAVSLADFPRSPELAATVTLALNEIQAVFHQLQHSPNLSSASSNLTVPDSMASLTDARITQALTLEDGSNYEIVSALGKGGQGRVFVVLDKLLNQRFAMKLITPLNGLDKYLEEARVLFNLKHENIVSLHHCTRYKSPSDITQQLAIVMELLGITLEEFTRNEFSLQNVLRVATGILAGLQELHANGYVHRDLKPSNVCVQTCDGQPIVKILDLGLAMKEEDLRDPSNAKRLGDGTVHWRSPEQESRGALAPITHLTDIWAAGQLLAHLLTHQNLRLHSATEVDVQGKLIDCARQATLREPYARIKSAKKLLKRLTMISLYSPEKELQPLVKPSWFHFPYVFESSVGGFRPELLTLNLDRSFHGFAVPDSLQSAYKEARSVVEKDRKLWNGSSVAVRKAYRSRTPGDEQHILTLECYLTEYFHHRGMRSLFDDTITPATRNEMLDALPMWQYPEYCTSLGTHITIITCDKKIMFCHRSKDSVAQSKGQITCGAVEGVSDKDIVGDKVDIYASAARALNEEIGHVIDNPAVEIKITAFMCKREQYEWGFVGYCKSRKSSHEVKASWRSAPVADGWEHDKLVFVDFNVSSIMAWIREQNGRVIASAVACALHTLQSENPREDISTALLRRLYS